MNKIALVLLSICFFACAGEKKEDGSSSGHEATVTSSDADEGKIIYSTNCKLCHGEDGTQGTSGSANLQKSTMNEIDVETIVSYGKGGMAPYKGVLSDDEIKKVVAYVITLRK